ncbi:MAG: translation initiation factor IF-2 N-terminal domain-containing protein, partial [Deltaproteobacteria bacterium]|nr:translation initiation factor IF-2 N-terminal domain-containing protein [Deltaproteobacteria bacterium]
MNKVRVYEVARDLGLTNRDVVAMFQSLGFSEVKNHMSAVEPEAVDRIKRKLEKKGDEEKKVVEQRLGAGVIKRRAKPGAEAQPSEAPAPDPARPSGRGVAAPPAEIEGPRASVPGPRASTPGARASAPGERVSDPGARPSAPGKAIEPEARASQSGAVVEVSELERAPEVDVPAPRASQRGRKAAVSQPGLAAPPASQEAPASVAPESIPAPPTVRAEEFPVRAAAPAPIAAETAAASVRPPALEAPRPTTTTTSPSQFPPRRPSQPPKSGIEVWEGRPGVP